MLAPEKMRNRVSIVVRERIISATRGANQWRTWSESYDPVLRNGFPIGSIES